MELPKNITQIGEADRRCRIYVEDYVISYLRQLNHQAENKNTGVALYGIRKEEDETAYLFFYGACKLDSLEREVRHLSQAQNQEIERLRKRFFPQQQFLGYRLLNGEMVEGFHICEQGICRYIAGYACFYEKNDNMLAYMLDSREGEAEPEKVDQEKYDRVRKRQEDRRLEYQGQIGQNAKSREKRKAEEQKTQEERSEQENRGHQEERNVLENRKVRERGAWRTGPGLSSGTMRLMRVSVVGMFALLCLAGMSTLNENGGLEGLQKAVTKLMADLSEQKLPEDGEAVNVMNPGQNQTLYTEGDLTDAIQKENSGAAGNPEKEGTDDGDEGTGDGSGGMGNGSGGTDEGSGGMENGSGGTGEGSGGTDDGREGTNDWSGGADDGEEGSDDGEEGTDDGDEGTNDGAGEANDGDEDRMNENPGEGDQEGTSGDQEQPETQETAAPVSYTIQKGDTLTRISLRHYGTSARVREICDLNNIADPDDIYFGQKILLP